MWQVTHVPDEQRPECFFVEVRKGTESHRMPLAYWPEQPTASPGHAGTAEHETWLQAKVKYRPDDVVITTYPKCGTTYTEQIVLLLLNGGASEALDPLSKNSANRDSSEHSGHHYGKVWPEGCVVPDGSLLPRPPGRPPVEEFVPLELSTFDALPAPRVIKTHADVGHALGPRTAGGSPAAARYIVVSRNPFDACVSCYYHAWNPSKNGWPFEAFASAWLEDHGNPGFGGWFDFHRSWLQVLEDAQAKANDTTGAAQVGVLWLHYEQLIHHPRREISRIAAFIGLPADDALLDKVVEGSAFDAMKAAATAAQVDASRTMAADHLRLGKIGDWRDHFSSELEAAFRAKFAERMRGSGFECDIGDGEMLVAPN